MESQVFVAIAFLLIPLAARFSMPRECTMIRSALHHPFGASTEINAECEDAE